MKIFGSILTSATSGSYNWSEAFDTRHAREGFFTLFYNITGGCTKVVAAYGVTFAYAASTSVTGTFIQSSILIKEGGTSTSGISGDGNNFIGFGSEVAPFIKVGAKATGDAAALTASLVMH